MPKPWDPGLGGMRGCLMAHGEVPGVYSLQQHDPPTRLLSMNSDMGLKAPS